MKLNSRNLKHFVEKGKIENIYLFSGPEIGEKNEIIELIEKKLFQNNESSKFTFYCGDDFDQVNFMNTLKSGLLFSEKKLVILKKIEQINADTISLITNYIIPKSIDYKKFEDEVLNKINKSDIKKEILDCYNKENNDYILKKLTSQNKKKLVKIFYSIDFKNYDSNTYLIMLNETKDKIPQSLIDLLSDEQNIIFWEMFESQKIEWIRNEFKNNSLYIDDESISFILDMIENNKEQLKDEIYKISALFKDSGINENVIKKNFIEEYLYHSKEETPFSLYSAMLEGDLTKSLEVLESLFLSDEYSLLNGLVWSHRRFLKALDLYENQKLPIIEIYSNLNITNKTNKEEILKGFKRYNFNHACLMFHYLSELDYYLKILPNKLKLIKLQEFIINFINGDMKKSFLNGDLEYLQT